MEPMPRPACRVQQFSRTRQLNYCSVPHPRRKLLLKCCVVLAQVLVSMIAVASLEASIVTEGTSELSSFRMHLSIVLAKTRSLGGRGSKRWRKAAPLLLLRNLGRVPPLTRSITGGREI